MLAVGADAFSRIAFTGFNRMLAVAPDSVRHERYALVTDITDDPALGSADKGRRLLEAGAAAVRDLIVRIGRMPGREIVGIQTVEKRR